MNYERLERERVLRNPPNTKPAHKDRIQWDQADLIAQVVVLMVKEEIEKESV